MPAAAPVTAMLQMLTDDIRECYQRAQEAKRCAEAANDLVARAEYLSKVDMIGCLRWRRIWQAIRWP